MQATRHGSGKDILLIDDVPAILSLLELALSEQGFLPHCASSSEQAIEICKSTPMRIVLADVDFLGNAGLQLLASMRTLQPDARICLMTAGLANYTDDDLKQLGVAQCLSKPFALPDLVAALKDHSQK